MTKTASWQTRVWDVERRRDSGDSGDSGSSGWRMFVGRRRGCEGMAGQSLSPAFFLSLLFFSFLFVSYLFSFLFSVFLLLDLPRRAVSVRNVNEQFSQVKLGLGLACIKRAADGMVSNSPSGVEEEKAKVAG